MEGPPPPARHDIYPKRHDVPLPRRCGKARCVFRARGGIAPTYRKCYITIMNRPRRRSRRPEYRDVPERANGARSRAIATQDLVSTCLFQAFADTRVPEPRRIAGDVAAESDSAGRFRDDGNSPCDDGGKRIDFPNWGDARPVENA